MARAPSIVTGGGAAAIAMPLLARSCAYIYVPCSCGSCSPLYTAARDSVGLIVVLIELLVDWIRYADCAFVLDIPGYDRITVDLLFVLFFELFLDEIR